MSQPLLRLSFDGNAREARLYVGFRKAAKGYTMGAPRLFNCSYLYKGTPLAVFYMHDRASFPSGRFDEALSGATGVKPTKEQVIAFNQYAHNWLNELHRSYPIIAAWGWSGRLSKPKKADPKFAEAWLEVVTSLGKKCDTKATNHLEKTLELAIKELPADLRERGKEVLALRNAAWDKLVTGGR